MSNIQHQSLAPAQHALNSDSQSAEQSRYPKSTTTVTSYHAIQALSLLQSDQSRTYPGMSSAAVFQLQAATSPEDITTWYGSPQLLTEPALRAHIGPLLGHTTTISAPEQQKSVTTTTGDVNIDPAIAQQQQMQGNISQPHTPQQMQMSVSPVLQQVPMEGQHQQSQSQPHSGNEGESGETPKKGGKRELSTSKRAAQNRAAQRAFRQRKEGYIKKLEEQVRDFQAMQESYKQIQTENYQLRDYIISLQSRVIEIQGEDALPPPPVTLVHPPPQLMLDPNQQQQAVPQQQQQPQQPPPLVPQQQQQQQQQIPAPMATMGQPQDISAGQKRPHDDSDSAFLQSIAQAAANPTAVTGAPQVSQAPVMNGFVSIQAADAAKAAARKSSSPQTKRVKAEEPKNNGAPVTSLNGTMASSS